MTLLTVTGPDGRALSIEVEPYGAHVLRIRVKERLPSGARLRVDTRWSDDVWGDYAIEKEFVVGRDVVRSPEGTPGVWRKHNTNFCGTSEILGVAWSNPVPATYALWLSNDTVPDEDALPLMVARVFMQSDQSVLNFAFQSCWNEGDGVPKPPWREGASTVILRRVRADGRLEAPLVLPLPPPPPETHSGIN